MTKKLSLIKTEYVIKGHTFTLRGATTGLRYFEKVFKTEKSARAELSKIEKLISLQKRDIDNMTVAVSSEEDKIFHNCSSNSACYWNVVGLFKKTEEKL